MFPGNSFRPVTRPEDRMQLGHGITFHDLYDRDGLARLDQAFVAGLKDGDTALHNRLAAARLALETLSEKDRSQLIIDLAPRLEDFIAELFAIHAPLAALKSRHFALAPLYSCKRLFIQRKAAKAMKPEEAQALSGEAVGRDMARFLLQSDSFDLAFARAVMGWLDTPDAHADALAAATGYAAWALYSKEGRHKHANGILFKLPRKLDLHHLVAVETELRDGVTVLKLPKSHLRPRRGFGLTDDGGTLEKTLDEANYCIWCHNQGKDSCSKGLKEKDGAFKKSPLDTLLAGCPLEEHISEMNFLKSEGVPVGALAAIVIANPMAAGTGHRICNDCMKSCIYQKQEPVNIPLAETRSLRDVLELPYGFEIYSLLTRWNPLNFERPLPRPATNRNVLVAGMGPAGYTLAHHLMNDGHTVVGIDGLKIEPLPSSLSGVTPLGAPVPFAPVRDIDTLLEALDGRVLAGFGGVAEYGITVRWDKNFLKIIRLLLERRRSFALLGGVRFGGTITPESAWQLGFDHIALCMGAGKPTIVDMENGLARGVRAASDFLMALQLTGAAKADSIANLQIRLPIVVIGGGLTAIDTATESLAYYPVQVEKFLSRYEILCAATGEDAVRANWSIEDAQIAEEFLSHARAIRAERSKPNPDIATLVDSWGGVKMVYRKRLIDAPSYRLNHEEVEKALEESIAIAENLEPVRVELDKWGHAQALVVASCTLQAAESSNATSNLKSETFTIPARTILTAAGTSPNTVLAREYPQSVNLYGKYFEALDEDGQPVIPEKTPKPRMPSMLAAWEQDGRAISFFGDLHPSFAGNVVKAMGSAKQGYPVISRMLAKRTAASTQNEAAFLARMNDLLRARVHAVNRLTPTIVEVVVKAPLAARAFEPGQFYRLQNFEANALTVSYPQGIEGFTQGSAREAQAGTASPRTMNTTLAMEGLAMTGASADKEQGLLSTIALEMGGSSDLCAYLQPGEPVVLMGPTGTPTQITAGETLLLAGGGLGNAVLFSIGAEARRKGGRVLYFAGYKKAQDRYKTAEIEQAADAVVWCCDEPHSFIASRPQDKCFHGNIVEAMLAYAQGRLGETAIDMHDADELIAIGSNRMMAAVGAARHGVLKPHLKPGHRAVGSINSPMQCMMKEICAQCLQQQVDPQTGAVTYVFTCFNQDQPLDAVSFPFLNDRLKQNSLQEKLTARWIDYCLKQSGRRAGDA